MMDVEASPVFAHSDKQQTACSISGCPGELALWLMECRFCAWAQSIGPLCRELFESRSLLGEVDVWHCPSCRTGADDLAGLVEFHALG